MSTPPAVPHRMNEDAVSAILETPDGMTTTLFEHQRKGVAWMMKMEEEK